MLKNFKKLSKSNQATMIIIFVVVIMGLSAAGYFFIFNPDENLSQEESQAAELISGIPGPCTYAPYGEECHFNTRAITEINGDRVESITAYGYVWNFNIDNNHQPMHAPVKLSSIDRYAEPYGPCYTDDNCEFDTRGTYENFNGERIEIITVGGRIWIYNITRGHEMVVSGKNLNNFSNLSEFGGPCYSSSVVNEECEALDTLDIRRENWEGQQLGDGQDRMVYVVSITRDNVIWDYSIETLTKWSQLSEVFGKEMSDLPRYESQCTTTDCYFDTRTYTQTKDGDMIESATRKEMIYNFPFQSFQKKINYFIAYPDTQVVPLDYVERYY